MLGAIADTPLRTNAIITIEAELAALRGDAGQAASLVRTLDTGSGGGAVYFRAAAHALIAKSLHRAGEPQSARTHIADCERLMSSLSGGIPTVLSALCAGPMAA